MVIFEVEGSLSVYEIRVVNLDSVDSKSDVKSGVWIEEDIETIDVEYGSGINTDKSYACLSDGTYLYSAQADHISIYDISGESEVLVREISGVSSVRHMIFTSSCDYLVCTARSNGVYIINVKEPKKAEVVNHFSSLELATGLTIDGDYLYVCSRYFGVEVWNISNPEEPIYCSTIRGEKEYQNCYVSNGYLYIAIYNENKIAIYDISNPYNAELITTFSPSCHPYSIYVDGNYLYTTIAEANISHSEDSYEGLANGFEIYDISDIHNPLLVSSTRLDGTFEAAAFDIYNLVVQGRYLYLSHTYNGIYIFDISDLYAPIRVCQISIPIYSYDEDEFRTNSNNGKLWPFNRDYIMPDPILDFCLTDGVIYFAGAYTGTYAVEYAEASQENISGSGSDYSVDNSSVENYYFYTTGVYSVEINDSIDAHAVLEYENLYYVACGDDGVVVLDQSLEQVSTIVVPGISKDLNVSQSGLLYVASDEGLYIYDISSGTADLLTYYSCSISDLQISEDGSRIIAQGDKVYVLELVQNGSRYYMKSLYEESFSGLYYRNVITGLVSDCLVAVQSSQDVKWWNLDNDSGEVLEYTATTKLGESQNYAAYGDRCIAIYRNGYVVFDPTEGEADFSALEVYRIDEDITGKAIVLDNNTLVVSKEYTGEVWIIDISDVTNPALIDKCTTDGSPDIAYGSENCILVPNRHGGLIRLTKSEE